MQKLVLPYRECNILAGYKIAPYVKEWGFPHYGIDLYSWGKGYKDRGNLYASGDGTVIECGTDNRVGNVLVILYHTVFCRGDGKTRDLIARYYHLDEIRVKRGQTVGRGTLIGIEGMTGARGYHTHVELDTDTLWPCYSPQVAGGSIIKKGVDSTLDPSAVFYREQGDVIHPTIYTSDWNTPADLKIPLLEEDGCPACAAKDTEIKKLTAKLGAIRKCVNENT